MDSKDYKVTGEKKFKLADFDTKETSKVSKADMKARIAQNMTAIKTLQAKMYAEGKTGILFVIQAMDAAGKDSVVDHAMSGMNPQGIFVHSFKQPSTEELAHGFLWRAVKCLPKRGHIAVFNRSYYEDVLVVKVHELYKQYNMPKRCLTDASFNKRYQHIRNFEEYLYDNGILVVKIFLHMGKDAQKERFLERIDEPKKHWKFSSGDIKERALWDQYQRCYEKAIRETASENCPWYVLPSDNQWYARGLFSDIILETLTKANPKYPDLPQEEIDEMAACKDGLLKE